MAHSTFPDYYKLLGVPKTASQTEIRQAYKRESLKSHPDRLVNANAAEKRRATERFQALSDAHFTLSDPTRRREYDALYNTRPQTERSDDPENPSFADFFSNAFGGGSAAGQQENRQRPNAEGTFTDVFEDLLRPEVESRLPLWAWLGAGAGGALGFIVANLPGMMVGGFAGNRIGAIRDAKGKSVAAVFHDLGGAQKAEILRALALKVLGAAPS
ncbi:DnaJ-domain-containing protein [Flagelloscypha sp. PMI_526]|nr:DnaJ-domain-containing protein [Flagelloscypha sp. PMI_526]